MQAEIDELSEQITLRIFEKLPAYGSDPMARMYLGHSVRQNADEVIKVMRDIPTDSAAARNVGLMTATATDVPLDDLLVASAFARDAFIARLEELAGEDQDVSAPVARLRAAHAVIVAAMTEEYRSAKAAGND
jgi:hypothetical protein